MPYRYLYIILYEEDRVLFSGDWYIKIYTMVNGYILVYLITI